MPKPPSGQEPRASVAIPRKRKPGPAKGTPRHPNSTGRPKGKSNNPNNTNTKNIDQFLEALAEGLSITGSAQRAGILVQTAYDWRNRDTEFAAAWDAAIESGTDKLEDVARKRAVNQSDTLMIFLLKGRRPAKYRERHEFEHKGNVTIQTVLGEGALDREPPEDK
jgi:hypothetical protein